MHTQLWEVVGGEDRGILVRNGKELNSKAEESRLIRGALIKELALDGERLNYELHTGSGPKTGWVSLKTKEKELVAKNSRLLKFPVNHERPKRIMCIPGAFKGHFVHVKRIAQWFAGRKGYEVFFVHCGDNIKDLPEKADNMHIWPWNSTDVDELYAMMSGMLTLLSKGDEGPQDWTAPGAFDGKEKEGFRKFGEDPELTLAFHKRIFKYLAEAKPDIIVTEAMMMMTLPFIQAHIKVHNIKCLVIHCPGIPEPSMPEAFAQEEERVKANEAIEASLALGDGASDEKPKVQTPELHETAAEPDVESVAPDPPKPSDPDPWDSTTDEEMLNYAKVSKAELRKFSSGEVQPAEFYIDIYKRMTYAILYHFMSSDPAGPLGPISTANAVRMSKMLGMPKAEWYNLRKAMQDIRDGAASTDTMGINASPDVVFRLPSGVVDMTMSLGFYCLPGSPFYCGSFSPMPKLLENGLMQGGRECLIECHKSMDQDLKEWLWAGEDTVPIVFIALGTLVRPSKKTFDMMCNGLDGGPWRVLWALPKDSQNLIKEGLDNKQWRFETFVPQVDVLKCNRVKCFVTHCGMNSTLEALIAGVPLVCCPFFMDQYQWANAVCKFRKAGIEVWKRGPPALFRKAVDQVLNVPEYRENAQTLSRTLMIQNQKVADLLGPEMSPPENLGVGTSVAAALIMILTQGDSDDKPVWWENGDPSTPTDCCQNTLSFAWDMAKVVKEAFDEAPIVKDIPDLKQPP